MLNNESGNDLLCILMPKIEKKGWIKVSLIKNIITSILEKMLFLILFLIL